MKSYKDISYRENSVNKKCLLDVFCPDKNIFYPVLIFVHGGSWYEGDKNWYFELGHHFAEKNVVSVVISYRLGHETTYDGMADDVACAVKWVKENIENYKGNSDKIFISGHSAGGHLSALVFLNPRFFNSVNIANPLKGCILIDAFGLNMDYVMQNNHQFFVKELEKVFTKDKAKWKDAAPVRFIKASARPFMILTGSRTYPYILLDNQVFKLNLETNKVPFIYKTLDGKNHSEMITHFKDPSFTLYDEIINFIK